MTNDFEALFTSVFPKYFSIEIIIMHPNIFKLTVKFEEVIINIVSYNSYVFR